MKRIVGVASIPGREVSLAEMIMSLYEQVDEFHVYLNNYDEVQGYLKLRDINVYRSQDFGDRGDAGKFFAT